MRAEVDSTSPNSAPPYSAAPKARWVSNQNCTSSGNSGGFSAGTGGVAGAVPGAASSARAPLAIMAASGIPSPKTVLRFIDLSFKTPVNGWHYEAFVLLTQIFLH